MLARAPEAKHCRSGLVRLARKREARGTLGFFSCQSEPRHEVLGRLEPLKPVDLSHAAAVQ